MRWSIALLLPSLAFAAPVPKVKEAVPPPFPLNVGVTREYEWRTGDKVETAYSDEITLVVKQKDGSSHVTVSRPNPNGPPHTTVVGVSTSGLTRLADDGMEYQRPPVMLKLPAEVGATWEEGETKYEVTAIEEVTVGAGKYKAAKVEMDTHKGKTSLWLAPGIGLVKSATKGNDTVLELKAFKPGK